VIASFEGRLYVGECVWIERAVSAEEEISGKGERSD